MRNIWKKIVSTPGSVEIARAADDAEGLAAVKEQGLFTPDRLLGKIKETTRRVARIT